jgi:nucleoside-diphosphate-sugar epimerase
MIPPSITLLGTGYTGHALLQLLESQGSTVSHTRRPASLTGPVTPRTLPFDIADPSTWSRVPVSGATVWVFPAEPVDLVRRFLKETGSRLGRIVAVGTTSSYRQSEEDALVSEDSGLDETQPRVRGELLLMEQGGVILRSAGIYGPALGALGTRHPLDWLRSGRIASREGYLNLIHVLDLARTIVAVLDSELAAEHLIVSDGTPRRWREIELWARAQGYLGEVRYPGGASRRPSRRLSNQKLLRLLAPELRHTDLYAELAALEGGRR